MNRLPGLDLLRATAIVWVMMFHALKSGIGSPLEEIAHVGWMGVDLFFVLSGYLIGWQLLKNYRNNSQPSLGQFYLRRSFRILPAYFAVVFLYFIFPAFREKEAIQPLWQFLTFTENMFIDFHGGKAFSHVWSLCVEEYFYLIFPLLAWLLMRKASAKKTIAYIILFVAVGMFIRGYIWLYELAPFQHIKSGEGSFRQLYFEQIYYPTHTRLDGLLAGVSLAILCVFRPEYWEIAMKRANILLLIGSIGLAVSVGLFNGDRLAFTTTVFGYPLLSVSLAFIVAAAASPHGIISRITIPGVAAIAAISFSLYLTHKAIFHMVESNIGPQLNNNNVLAFLLYSIAALSAGALLYWSVERPFLHLRNRISNRNKPLKETRALSG